MTKQFVTRKHKFDAGHRVMHERFKKLPDFPYEVSEFGSVRRLPSRRPLRSYVDRDGYKCFVLHKSGKRYAFKAHQLVLFTFVGPKPEKDSVTRHLDGDPSNNHFSNLTWGSHNQNWDDKIRHGKATIGSKNGRSKLSDLGVQMLRLEYKWADGVRGAKKKVLERYSKVFSVKEITLRKAISGRNWI